MNTKETHRDIGPDKPSMDFPDARIIRKIQSLPDMNPPEDLTARIMDNLVRKRPGRFKRLLRSLSQPFTITFTPVRWAPVLACLILLMANLWITRQSVSTWNPVRQEAELKYITGRHFLAQNHPEQALSYLQQAAEQVPDKADYLFWLGVSYWANQDRQNEEASYKKALQLNPDFVPAHLYLGHSYMENGDWQAALDRYHKVLMAVPNHKEAVFNSALALQHLGRIEQENQMWVTYLHDNPVGGQSLQALNHLTANGDFRFQPVTVGTLRMVTPRIEFEDNTAQPTPAALTILSKVGQELSLVENDILHIVVYVENDTALAEKRAKKLKKQLLSLYPGMVPDRIRVSWFDLGSTVMANDKAITLPADVRIFTQKVSNSDLPKEEIL